MYEQVVDIQTEGLYINVKLGSIILSKNSEEVGRLPLSDISALIISNPASSISCTAISRLLKNKTPIIFSDEKYLPIGMALPINSTLTYGSRLQSQIDASKPLKKSLWKSIIKKKIENQKLVLDHFGESTKKLNSLYKKVLSGDSSNVEAQAARDYWPKLFGPDFRRDKRLDGTNSLLNYGYTILRASTARAISASGLNPSFSVHHSNKENPYALVDDLMEPYRPIVDYQVKLLEEVDIDYIFKESKSQLVGVLGLDVKSSNGEITTLSNSIFQTCQSFVRSLNEKKNLLNFSSLVWQ